MKDQNNKQQEHRGIDEILNACFEPGEIHGRTEIASAKALLIEYIKYLSPPPVPEVKEGKEKQVQGVDGRGFKIVPMKNDYATKEGKAILLLSSKDYESYVASFGKAEDKKGGQDE